MKKGILSFILISIFLTGCGKKSGFQALEIPKEPARLKDLGVDSTDSTDDSEDAPEYGDQDAPAEDSGKSLVDIAKWVVQNESRKVGAACNFFIQRVFYLMGFGRSSWTANEFDRYVKDHFDSYKEETFVYDRNGDERERLKEYIWSFPERTGLIMQWKRNSPHGHIGIVQRVGDTLVIYHASLNDFRPKAQTATLNLLLYRTSSASSYRLNVFSNLKKKTDSSQSEP